MMTPTTTIEEMGTSAFAAGLKCAPCLDPRVMSLVTMVSQPLDAPGPSATLAILKAWNRGWHAANLARVGVSQ